MKIQQSFKHKNQQSPIPKWNRKTVQQENKNFNDNKSTKSNVVITETRTTLTDFQQCNNKT